VTSPIVYAIAIHPTTTTTLYAGTFDGGVFRSTDAGASWSSVNHGLPYPTVTALAIDPAGASTVFAGNGASVWQSTPPVPVELSSFRIE
jgi:ligand-binding sensor domain-containing protein